MTTAHKFTLGSALTAIAVGLALDPMLCGAVLVLAFVLSVAFIGITSRS